ncbi:MAG: hypothetical protein KG029_01225 [Bacteroidetes bacterium]|nr:hypothetical protein [Bacteroidota bacterium]
MKTYIIAPLLLYLLIAIISAQSIIAQSNNGLDILKGTQNFGLSFSVSAKQVENDNQLIQYVHNSKNNYWNISVEGGYTIADYANTGLRLSFGQSAESGIITPMNSTKSNSESFSRAYTIAPYLMTYLPIGKNHFMYLTNRVELLYRYESKLKETVNQELLIRQHYTIHKMGAGFRPGVLVLVQEGFGFEVSLNVLGLTYSIETNTNTNQPDTKKTEADIDLKLDILKLNLGFSIYF